jgi:hypothetical protein
LIKNDILIRNIKLKNLKSVANNALRQSIAWKGKYRIDPFEHYTPEEEIMLDLITGSFSPERDGDDVEEYYSNIYEWFHDVLPKEGIALDAIDKAILIINSKGKLCIIVSQGREFRAELKFK